MVPRVDTFMIDISDDINDSLQKIIFESYSRIPLYEDDKDNIKGVVNIKDVLLNIEKLKSRELNLLDIKRDPLFILESTHVDDLLVHFKKSKQLLAIIIDEFGGVTGIVTLEDLIKEIVGEIDDEYDETTKTHHQINQNTYIINGSMNLETFNNLFEEKITSEAYETVAGYIIEKIGYIPNKEDKIEIDINSHVLKIETIRGNRISKIKVLKK